MKDFNYVNKQAQSSGEHEVHVLGCSRFPSEENRLFLGIFESRKDALKKANQYFYNVDGCYHCCPEIHTK